MSCATWSNYFAGNLRTELPYSLRRKIEIMPVTIEGRLKCMARQSVRRICNHGTLIGPMWSWRTKQCPLDPVHPFVTE